MKLQKNVFLLILCLALVNIPSEHRHFMLFFSVTLMMNL